jgi:cell division protein ZapA (FtsZ GTPase activity inhibitor)
VDVHSLEEVEKKEVIQVAEETDREADLLQEESRQVEGKLVEEVQALLEVDLMLLQKKLKKTKDFFFQQQNPLNNKAQNKQHLQIPYFQI